MRYYYTNSLAAALMAQQFGMKFKTEFHINYTTENRTPEIDFKIIDKIYISPDSLHLLIPQTDDVIINEDNYPSLVNDFGYMQSCTLEEARAWVKKGYKIIMRGDTPFMWPESEE